MTFTLHFDTDNAVFEDDAPYEIARILRAVADRVESGADCSQPRTVLDVNGNKVGQGLT